MRKKFLMGLTAAVLSAAMGLSAYAMGWQQDSAGRYWYGTNEDNSQWCSNGWWWIFNAYESRMKCYYFDEQGYMLSNTTTPDGYQVNADGQWISNGTVVAIVAPEPKSFMPADFDYTAYIPETYNNAQGSQPAGQQQEESQEAQPQQEKQPETVQTQGDFTGFCNEVERRLNSAGLEHSLRSDANNNVTVNIWGNITMKDAKMTRNYASSFPQLKAAWNQNKSGTRDVAQFLYNLSRNYGLDIDVSYNLVTSDTKQLILGYTNGVCTRDYVND
ncbi:MAG: hypothetical protein Q4C63_03615 [Eubacteriales bacterium]|nr:hypothetical protein [Eubacteriales bacterium]